MRACVIFNPAARGEKARRFRKQLESIGQQSELKQTSAAGDARRLAAQCVRDGFEIIVAAGGDGTLNEVLNGICDEPDGLKRARLGVLPLGTVNVFARELRIPTRLEQAWETILRARETRIDLPVVEFGGPNGSQQCRYFAQLGGAGLDARAIELVKWQVKKIVGPVAYILAGLHAVVGAPSQITATAENSSATGGLVLIGNGQLYGGQFKIFPEADLRDGLLDVCVFPRVNWLTLARCSPGLLFGGKLPASTIRLFQTGSVRLTSPTPTPLQVDGELIGHLPATFSVRRSALSVIVP